MAFLHTYGIILAMSERLTAKQAVFVKEYAKSGDTTGAALIAFDTVPKNAHVMAAQAMRQPLVAKKIQSIADRLPSDLLVRKHKKLLEQKMLNYFSFKRTMTDDDIKEHFKINGWELINIIDTEKSRMAYYAIDDAQAIAKGLEMAYKLKGLYQADEVKHSGSVNITAFRVDEPAALPAPAVDVTVDKTVTK
jgi:hypothetical protein